MRLLVLLVFLQLFFFFFFYSIYPTSLLYPPLAGWLAGL